MATSYQNIAAVYQKEGKRAQAIEIQVAKITENMAIIYLSLIHI